MLEVNPYFRPSAKQILRHKVFDTLRQEIGLKNTIPPFRIKVKIDHAEEAINYEESDFRPELKNKFLRILLEESKKFGSSSQQLEKACYAV